MSKDDGIHPVQCCQYHQDQFDALPKDGQMHFYASCDVGLFPRAETRTAHEIAIDDVKWAVNVIDRLLHPNHPDDPVGAPKNAGNYIDTMRARYKDVGYLYHPECENPPKVSTGQEVMTVTSAGVFKFDNCNCGKGTGGHWETCPAYDPNYKRGEVGFTAGSALPPGMMPLRIKGTESKPEVLVDENDIPLNDPFAPDLLPGLQRAVEIVDDYRVEMRESLGSRIPVAVLERARDRIEAEIALQKDPK